MVFQPQLKLWALWSTAITARFSLASIAGCGVESHCTDHHTTPDFNPFRTLSALRLYGQSPFGVWSLEFGVWRHCPPAACGTRLLCVDCRNPPRCTIGGD